MAGIRLDAARHSETEVLILGNVLLILGGIAGAAGFVAGWAGIGLGLIGTAVFLLGVYILVESFKTYQLVAFRSMWAAIKLDIESRVTTK